MICEPIFILKIKPLLSLFLSEARVKILGKE